MLSPAQPHPLPHEQGALLCKGLTICHLLNGNGGAAVLTEGHQPLDGLPVG